MPKRTTRREIDSWKGPRTERGKLKGAVGYGFSNSPQDQPNSLKFLDLCSRLSRASERAFEDCFVNVLFLFGPVEVDLRNVVKRDVMVLSS